MFFYKKISNILKSLEKNKVSFKTAIYDQIKEFSEEKNFTKIYKLVIEVRKHKDIITQIMETFFYDQYDFIKDKESFMVMIYEKFFSKINKKIGGKLMRILKEKEKEIRKFIEENFKEISDEYEENKNILYFRINKQNAQNNLSVKKMIENNPLIEGDNDIKGIFYLDKTLDNDKSILKKLFEMNKNNSLIFQTKSSCLPAFILSEIYKEKINYKFDIIDCCSAPGNKTLQLSEYFANSRIYAFEINLNRFKILTNNINDNNFNKNIVALNKDFLEVDPSEEIYKNVKIVLADPSCSGSGTMNNALDDKDLNDCCLNIAGSDYEKSKIQRLKKLYTFQIKILEHALKFPNIEYISYSTCSVYMTENEFVTNKILKSHPNLKLVDIHQYLKGKFHEGLTEETKNSMRVCRKCHKIDGFYVSVFQVIK